MKPCTVSHRVKSGRMYKARDLKTAEIIDTLRDISIHLSYSIDKQDGEYLRQKLQNTTFKELIDKDPNILGWNYDKGREIGLKIYKSTGLMYHETEVIDTLFHELAHSLTQKNGHHPNWEEKDKHLQSFAPKYVKILNLKISDINKQYE
jgi:hypothetical protein